MNGERNNSSKFLDAERELYVARGEDPRQLGIPRRKSNNTPVSSNNDSLSGRLRLFRFHWGVHWDEDRMKRVIGLKQDWETAEKGGLDISLCASKLRRSRRNSLIIIVRETSLITLPYCSATIRHRVRKKLLLTRDSVSLFSLFLLPPRRAIFLHNRRLHNYLVATFRDTEKRSVSRQIYLALPPHPAFFLRKSATNPSPVVHAFSASWLLISPLHLAFVYRDCPRE